VSTQREDAAAAASVKEGALVKPRVVKALEQRGARVGEPLIGQASEELLPVSSKRKPDGFSRSLRRL
jgi:hypothetical protein